MIITAERAQQRLAQLPPLRAGCSCCDCGERRCLTALLRYYGAWVGEAEVEAEPALDMPDWLRDAAL
jgi:hypothetical protein